MTPLKSTAAIALSLTLLLPPADASKPFQTRLTKDQQVLHVVERTTFGARPGDIERVRHIGIEKWLDEQLHPEQLPENPLLEPKLADLKSMQLPAPELFRMYPPPQVIALMAQGSVPMPQDPLLRHGVQRAVERYKLRKSEGKQAAADEDTRNEETADPETGRQKMLSILGATNARTLRSGTPEEKRQVLASLNDEQIDQLLLAAPNPMRRAIAAAGTTAIRRKAILMNAPVQVIAFDLNESKIQRAVYSNHQLEELMVDFWYNHFNVFFDKGADRHLVPSYERDAIRPHALGKFKDLLTATAHHPAMLFYLDNWQSVGAQPPRRMAMKAGGAKRGLNENYARELLELHTLGVDGGYTQKDVTEVARALTGWTIRDPRRSAEFFYNDRVHDKGEKTVLGVKIPAGGSKSDGDKVLDIVLHHPSTAKFISRKLAMRFVADDAPPELIERMAKTFTDSDGDIRAVLKTMFLSKEFLSAGAYRAKVKTPFEMVVSAARALNADVNFAGVVGQQLAQLGQPLYRKVEPTGYSSANSDWINSAALLGRMNFALSLAQNKVAGVRPNVPSEMQQAQLEQLLIPAGLSPATRRSMEKALQDKEANPEMIAGLLLGSPEFQRR
jgi:uncharacterized protein (DUF1800 family)